MAEKHLVSFSLLYVAAAVLASQAHGVDICDKANYPPLCRTAVKGASDPTAALKAAIELLIAETQNAKASSLSFQLVKSLEVCKQNYDDAVDDLQKSLQYLTKNDKPSLQISLSGALTDYVTCDDAMKENGELKKVGGLLNFDSQLRHLATNCLYLATLLK